VIKNEKVVVLGGAGFLGSHIADHLSELGCEVVIFDAKPSQWIKPSQKMIVGNILDPEVVREAIEGAKYVYHLAGMADLGEAAVNPKETLENNIIGSANVIEVCSRAKIKRLLIASTIYVYSDKGSFYRASKQAVESIMETYHEHNGLEYTILRYGSLYGPRAQDWNGLKRYVSQAMRKGVIVYPGTGEEKREYIHVKDAAQLSVNAVSSEFANECLTLTGTQVMTSYDLLRMVKEISGKDIELEFSQSEENYNQFHYSLTPYRYSPRGGKKIVPSSFIDLGQGILELIEEIDNEDM
jgi:UDP-glucose 4-epimerase